MGPTHIIDKFKWACAPYNFKMNSAWDRIYDERKKKAKTETNQTTDGNWPGLRTHLKQGLISYAPQGCETRGCISQINTNCQNTKQMTNIPTWVQCISIDKFKWASACYNFMMKSTWDPIYTR